MIFGYARVSTDGQTLDAQQAALRDAGCERVYSEKISGAVTDRPALAKAIGGLGSGDTLVVCKLDRLARSTRDLLNTLAAVAEAGASFKSLSDHWADTTTPHGRLMLTVLGGLAEFERHLILARTSEGRQRAQQRGVKFGRKPKLTLHQRVSHSTCQDQLVWSKGLATDAHRKKQQRYEKPDHCLRTRGINGYGNLSACSPLEHNHKFFAAH